MIMLNLTYIFYSIFILYISYQLNNYELSNYDFITYLLYINVGLLIVYYIIKYIINVIQAFYRYKMEELEIVYDIKTYNYDVVESVSNITDIINILNKNVLFSNLYNFIFECKLRHLPKYTNIKDLSKIPKSLTNGNKMEDVDRYMYSVLLTITNKAKETKNLSFEYFLECLEIDISQPLNKYEGTELINKIENEYFQFLCFHDKLNELNCYIYKHDYPDKCIPNLKNNRFYI